MAAAPGPGVVREIREVDKPRYCKEDLEYQHGSICCVKCPAGTHLTSPCTKTGEKGTCEECNFGTYTEFSNNLHRCLTCTPCRPDQIMTRPCIPTKNTGCQCRPGRFCDPHEACEHCNLCKRCNLDEVKVRNCTSTSNAECKKMHPTSGSGHAEVIVPVVLVLFLLLVIVPIGIWVVKKYRPDSQSRLRNMRKGGQVGGSSACNEGAPLYNSLNSSASNSQHSLTGPQSAPLLSQQPTFTVSMEPTRREHEPFPPLEPVNGEESLRRSFDFFEKVDIDQHKRFFRHLGLDDNVIKSKESLPYEDRIHELLNIWVERVGRRASLNDLLETLLNLNQRKTAEDIKNEAISSGYYTCDG
ncbi:hematopoietic death receptor isoform X2 [Cololabis saira]|uniref:hematopoietic death receptor isoform X2 n=1 Tax=Cololabis saira TaxID=129043 RepID=UPI002AD4AB52|nr:hematopoietic death receptor isoform X2 [Cololabis saira]